MIRKTHLFFIFQRFLYNNFKRICFRLVITTKKKNMFNVDLTVYELVKCYKLMKKKTYYSVLRV